LQRERVSLFILKSLRPLRLGGSFFMFKEE
jgi:hypothetical protein